MATAEANDAGLPLALYWRQGEDHGQVSSLTSGNYVLALTPHADNLLRRSTQAAVDRFRRRYVPGVVRSNLDVSPIFDRATAIALKRVLLDRQR